MRKTLIFAFHLFCVITTTQVILTSLLSPDAVVNHRILYGMLLTSLVGVLPSVIISAILAIWSVKMSRRLYFFIIGVHFIITASLVFASLNHFGILNQHNTIRVIITFLVIYIMTNVTVELQNKKSIDELNRRINATHRD